MHVSAVLNFKGLNFKTDQKFTAETHSSERICITKSLRAIAPLRESENLKILFNIT